MKYHLIISAFVLLALNSCNTGKENEGDSKNAGRIPVTITHISNGNLNETVELNAVSECLLKTNIKSNTNGYLKEVKIKLGESISKGQKLFVIKSKEAEYLDNTVNALDSSFRFSGLVNIISPGNGYVTQLSNQPGDYIQEGETLAAISDLNSMVFMLELPYELRPFLALNKTVILTLPDGQKISGTLFSPMPVVDPASQTLSYIIHVAQGFIPENLVAKLNFVKSSKMNAVSLPKEAVLSNEVQSEFWIMKMTDSITAVKVIINKGLETADRVEIVSPELKVSDKILLNGNYGLPDTVKVKVENK